MKSKNLQAGYLHSPSSLHPKARQPVREAATQKSSENGLLVNINDRGLEPKLKNM